MITNKTVIAAIKIGFDFANIDLSEDLEKQLIDFLHENSEKLKPENHFCEVKQHSNGQYVSFGNFNSSGDIVRYSDYWGKRKQRIYHSDFLHINEDGTPVNIRLYCFSK